MIKLIIIEQAETTTASQEVKQLKPSDYIRLKWRELSSQGLLEGMNYTYINKKGISSVRHSKDVLLEILSVDPSYEAPDSKKPGAKIKKSSQSAEETEI